MKRTYQPSKRKRRNKHGFRARMKTKGGQNILRRRRRKGRAKLTPVWPLGHTSFPKTSRLKLASDFRDLIKSGRSFRGQGLAIYFRTSTTTESRLGILVSKRIFKRAVDRNRVKRAIREFYRKEKHHFSKPLDLVVRVLERRKYLKTKDLQEGLSQLFIKVSTWSIWLNYFCAKESASIKN